jgi:Glyoxalase/Bleomycin resistance protein/Dioxygenase superfamily
MRDFCYMGEPYPIELSDLQIELIQQRNDVPSMYRDHLAAHGECLHHVSSWTTNYESDLEKIIAADNWCADTRVETSQLMLPGYSTSCGRCRTMASVAVRCFARINNGGIRHLRE